MLVQQHLKQNCFQATSPELKSCQLILHKNKKLNVQDISNTVLHNVQMKSLINAIPPFENHLSRLFPQSLDNRLNFIKIVRYSQFLDDRVTLEFLTQVILGSLTVQTKRKSAYVTKYARNHSCVCTCSVRELLNPGYLQKPAKHVI